MPRFTDTIAALATPPGTSAIAVLRVSGPDTARLATELAGGRTPLPRRVRRLDYRDRAGAVLDDVLAVFFAGPQSYTGEDSLEISCHGSGFIAQKILEDLLARGARVAEPGEFTQRAFVNGRMDLSQAEAVMDLIQARSARALASANRQLRGALGRRTAAAVDELLAVIARVEAYIDFPEEDLPNQDREDLVRRLSHLRESVGKLLATKHYGDVLRDGARTVIVGEPNVGKSSLLNALVGHDRALVSAEPGTTRDYLEERIMLGPHCLRLVDTAGLNHSPTPLEELGMEKTRERIAEADLFLVVADGSRAGGPLFPQELDPVLVREKAILVLNKSDLGCAAAAHGFDRSVRVSALTGAGIETLKEQIGSLVDGLRADSDEDQVAINARHAASLQLVVNSIGESLSLIEQRSAAELLASALRDALHGLEEIAGRIDNERMLDQLFATFCIGK